MASPTPARSTPRPQLTIMTARLCRLQYHLLPQLWIQGWLHKKVTEVLVGELHESFSSNSWRKPGGSLAASIKYTHRSLLRRGCNMTHGEPYRWPNDRHGRSSAYLHGTAGPILKC